MLSLVALVLSSPQMARSAQPEGTDCTLTKGMVLPSLCPPKCKVNETSGELVRDAGDVRAGGTCQIFNDHCTPELCWLGSTFKEQCEKVSKESFACKRCHGKGAFWCEKYLVGGGSLVGSHYGCGKIGGRTETDKCYKSLSDTYHAWWRVVYRKPKEGEDEEDKNKFDKACAAMLKVKECYASTRCKSVGAAFADTRAVPGALAGWSRCAGLETFECEAQYMKSGKFTNKDCFIEDGVIKMKSKETKKETKKEPENDTKKGTKKDTDKKTDKKDTKKDTHEIREQEPEVSGSPTTARYTSLLHVVMPMAMIVMRVA